MEKGKIIKDQARFFSKTPFHAVRLENPIMVMANEVEPVTGAKICLQKIAQQSGVQILERVRSRLIEKMNVEYTQAYNRFYVEGRIQA